MVAGRRSPMPRPPAAAATFPPVRWGGRGYRLGYAGLLSIGIHVVGGLLLTTMVLRVSTQMPPIRVFLRAPAGPSGPQAIQEGGLTVSRSAEVVAPPQVAVPAVKPLARHPIRRSTKSSAQPLRPAVEPSAEEDNRAAIGAAGPDGGGGADSGMGGGDGPASTEPSSDDPVLISQVLPQYPALARMRGIEGQVVLQAIVAPDGRIEPDVKVVQSIPLLDNAAIAALRQWRFRPARDHAGAPMRVSLRVPVRFVLR